MYFLSRKCIFCDKNRLLRKGLEILYCFYIEISARKAAKELNIDYGIVYRKFMQFRKLIVAYYDITNLHHSNN